MVWRLIGVGTGVGDAGAVGIFQAARVLYMVWKAVSMALCIGQNRENFIPKKQIFMYSKIF